eukprot:scaffold22956_cov135-Isochrysis_galbana.AAC.1
MSSEKAQAAEAERAAAAAAAAKAQRRHLLLPGRGVVGVRADATARALAKNTPPPCRASPSEDRIVSNVQQGRR